MRVSHPRGTMFELWRSVRTIVWLLPARRMRSSEYVQSIYFFLSPLTYAYASRQIWSVSTKELIHTLQGHSREIYALEFIPGPFVFTLFTRFQLRRPLYSRLVPHPVILPFPHKHSSHRRGGPPIAQHSHHSSRRLPRWKVHRLGKPRRPDPTLELAWT